MKLIVEIKVVANLNQKVNSRSNKSIQIKKSFCYKVIAKLKKIKTGLNII